MWLTLSGAVGIVIVGKLWAKWHRRRSAVPPPMIVSAVGQIVPRAIVTLVEPEVLTPLGFERHCAALLRAAGWHATLTAGSGDQGVDVLARRGDLSLVVQCKFYSKPIGNRAVQEAIAGQSFTGATHAAVVSNQPYTSAARDLAQRTRVMLLTPADLSALDRFFTHDRRYDGVAEQRLNLM